MGPLTALLLATPVFGLSLTPPDAALAPTALAATVVAQPAALTGAMPPLSIGDDDEADDGDDADDEREAEEADGGGVSMEQYGAMMRERSDLAAIHKPFGIATWVSMLATLTLGFFQWKNLYGPFSALEDTPCVTGEGIIGGQQACSGTPYVHLTSGILTTALYATTFTLSLMMPDPDGLDEGDSAYASNLRTHKVLRWVHFVGMIAQIGLGVVIANSDAFGIDRANDYGTLQALAAVHMGIGIVTFGALTWAGAMFLF